LHIYSEIVLIHKWAMDMLFLNPKTTASIVIFECIMNDFRLL